MKNLAKLLFYFTILYMFCLDVGIAEEDNNKQPSQEQATNSSKPKQTVNQKIGKRGQVKTLEEFVPSEEVSADKPVAFPNDI